MAYRCLRYDIGNPLRGISDWSSHSNGYYKWHICIVQVLIKVWLKFDLMLRTSSGRSFTTQTHYPRILFVQLTAGKFNHCALKTVAIRWREWKFIDFPYCNTNQYSKLRVVAIVFKNAAVKCRIFPNHMLPCCVSCPQIHHSFIHHRLFCTAMPAIRLSIFWIYTLYSIDIWHFRLRLNWMENLITTYYCVQQWSALNNIITAYSVLVISIESPYFVNAINLNAWN